MQELANLKQSSKARNRAFHLQVEMGFTSQKLSYDQFPAQ